MTTPSDPSRRLASPLIRGAIAAVLLAVVGGAFLLTRAFGDDGGTDGPTLAGAPTPAATAEPDTGMGPLDDRAPVRGQLAPDFVLRTPSGTTVQLSKLRGRVVWINFWATWCVPCKKELPDIQRLADEYPDDLVVLAVNWEENADDARQYFDERGFDMTILLDRSGAVFDQYRLQGLPDSFFIDREGNLAAWQWGPLTEKMMRDRLATAGLP
jgi:thiol-disulfide isomerase/thioredoxin